ncbi:hypothetical protein V8D89_011096 [Ganoderma adspersum]
MPLALNGYAAHICCDGKELAQYQPQQEDERTVTCWIPSEGGKSFTVHWRDYSAATLVQVNILVDGRCVGRMAHERKPGGYLSGVLSRPDQMRPFLFSQLQLTDDEAVAPRSAAAASALAKLGCIEIEMRSVFAFVEAPNLAYVGDIPEIGPVHERSKKAWVHAVSIGKAVPHPLTMGKTALGLEQEPFVVFRFFYRPIEVLRAGGIAPLPPWTSKKRPFDDRDTDPQDAGLSGAKRARGYVQEGREVKAEEGDSEGEEDEEEDRAVFLQEQILMLQSQLAQVQAKRTKPIAKREPSPINVPFNWSNEVIDLT